MAASQDGGVWVCRAGNENEEGSNASVFLIGPEGEELVTVAGMV